MCWAENSLGRPCCQSANIAVMRTTPFGILPRLGKVGLIICRALATMLSRLRTLGAGLILRCLHRPSAAHHVDRSLAAAFRRNLVSLGTATRRARAAFTWR